VGGKCEEKQEKTGEAFASACECNCVRAMTIVYPYLSPPSLVLWNCRVWSLVLLGAAGLSAQRGHVPFGLKEERARCTTLNRLRGDEEEKSRQEQWKKHLSVGT
jgi:hypothetical protein